MNIRLSILLVFISTQLLGQSQWYHNLHIVDVERGEIVRNQAIKVDNDQIAEIKDDSKLKKTELEGAIDMEGMYASPGLVDGHIHIFQSGGLYTRPDVIDLRHHVSYEEEKTWLKENVEDLLERYLKCGITTVVDVGGPLYQLPMRDTLNEKEGLATLYITGPLISTYQPEAFNNDEPPIIKVNSPEEARQKVRDQLPYRPDLIKIWYIVFPGQPAEKNLPIIQATIDESHKNGLKVAVHATQLETARLSIVAGADILVHSVGDHPIDEDFVDLLKENGTVYIPTIIVHYQYDDTFSQTYQPTAEDYAFAHPMTLGSLLDLEHLPDHKLIDQYKESSDLAQDRIARQKKVRLENLKKLMDAGVIVATGTDAGNIGTLHASSYFEELDAMVEAGLTNADIMRASTINGARILGHDDQYGSIGEQKKADIIFYDQNPLEDLKTLTRPTEVIKNGVLYDPTDLDNITPEILAQQQLNAYNCGNIEAFLDPYAADVVISNYGGGEIANGHEAMRKIYGPMFEKNPDLHCELVNRIVLGNRVIDHERIHGLGEIFEAVAVYTIKNQKIVDVRFLREN